MVQIHWFSSKYDFKNSVIQWQHILFNIQVNNQNFVIKTKMSYDVLSKFAFNLVSHYSSYRNDLWAILIGKLGELRWCYFL